MRVDVHHHVEPIERTLLTILRTLRHIMATQSEIAARIVAFTEQLEKAKGEIVSALEVVIASVGNASPELTAAVDALAVKVQALDDLNADEPVE